MKKFFVITLAFMQAFFLLTACGANNSSDRNLSQSAEETPAVVDKTGASYLDSLFIFPNGHSYTIETLNVGYKDEQGLTKGMMLSVDSGILPFSKGIYSFQISGEIDGTDAFTFLLWNVEIEDENSSFDLSQKQLYKYTFNVKNSSTYIFDEYLGIWPTPKEREFFNYFYYVDELVMSLDISSGFSKSLYVLDPDDAKNTSLRFFTSKYCLYYDMRNLSPGIIDIELTDENLRQIEKNATDTGDTATDTSDTDLDPVLNGDFSLYAGTYTFTYDDAGTRLPDLDDTATLDINGCWNGAPPIAIEKKEDGSYYITYEEWVYHEEAGYSTGSGCYIFPIGVSSIFVNDDISRIRALPDSDGGVGTAPYYKD